MFHVGNSLAIALLPAIPALLKESDGRVINSPVVVVEVSVDSSDQHPFRVAFPMISVVRVNDIHLYTILNVIHACMHTSCMCIYSMHTCTCIH